MELKLTPFGIVASIKDKEARAKKKPVMGEVEIEVERDGKTIKAYVEIEYFRRPRPSTYWIDGDRGDDGEVILGQACDNWGRRIFLSADEQDKAIEAFKAT